MTPATERAATSPQLAARAAHRHARTSVLATRRLLDCVGGVLTAGFHRGQLDLFERERRELCPLGDAIPLADWSRRLGEHVRFLRWLADRISPWPDGKGAATAPVAGRGDAVAAAASPSAGRVSLLGAGRALVAEVDHGFACQYRSVLARARGVAAAQVETARTLCAAGQALAPDPPAAPARPLEAAVQAATERLAAVADAPPVLCLAEGVPFDLAETLRAAQEAHAHAGWALAAATWMATRLAPGAARGSARLPWTPAGEEAAQVFSDRSARLLSALTRSPAALQPSTPARPVS